MSILIDKLPPLETTVLCRIRHWNTRTVQKVDLIRVDADDHSWVTADDRSELSHDWDVISWKSGDQWIDILQEET